MMLRDAFRGENLGGHCPLFLTGKDICCTVSFSVITCGGFALRYLTVHGLSYKHSAHLLGESAEEWGDWYTQGPDKSLCFLFSLMGSKGHSSSIVLFFKETAKLRKHGTFKQDFWDFHF